MHADTEQYVNELREQIKSAQNTLDESKKRFGDNKDEFLHERIRYAQNHTLYIRKPKGSSGL